MRAKTAFSYNALAVLMRSEPTTLCVSRHHHQWPWPHASHPVSAGKETPYNLRTKLNVNVGSAALVLTDPEGQQILRAALDDLKSAVKVFPSTLEVVAAVQAMGCVTPEGTLIRTGTDLRRVSMQRSVSARALEGGFPRL